MSYEFVVCAIFKNEQHALVEWIEHYKFHGAQHIYLIDDNSNDNSVDLIKPYIDINFVTLFNANNWDRYLHRQRDMYNTFFLPLVNQRISKWFLICDLDEFIWSPICIDLKNLLATCNHLSQIQMNHSLFGSSGHIEQPKCIIKYFTYKSKTAGLLLKYFVNSNYNFNSLEVHHATYVNEEEGKKSFIKLDEDYYFIYNHYRIQSLNFWKNVKCTRGDADNYLVRVEF